MLVTIVEKEIDITPKEKEKSSYQIQRNKPMPSQNHGYIQNKIGGRLDIKYEGQYNVYSELSLKLPKVKEAVPDIAVYPYKEINWEHDLIKITTPPILVIEILSPTQNINEILDKFSKIYFPGGVKSAWLVIPPLKMVGVYAPDMNYQPFHDGIIVDKNVNISLDLSSVFKPKQDKVSLQKK